VQNFCRIEPKCQRAGGSQTEREAERDETRVSTLKGTWQFCLPVVALSAACGFTCHWWVVAAAAAAAAAAAGSESNSLTKTLSIGNDQTLN
jgi:hypothetical protein